MVMEKNIEAVRKALFKLPPERWTVRAVMEQCDLAPNTVYNAFSILTERGVIKPTYVGNTMLFKKGDAFPHGSRRGEKNER